jgi:pyruvate/2-oxoglutarate dehydrogenase complex dihydrolipoamide dehydrogenase (E3) component
MTNRYDLIVVGAGSGGITAAEFGAHLGIKVALIEKSRIGGDCTWTGCVPSKALLKVAKVAHTARTAGEYGICSGDEALQVDMRKVRDYIQQAIRGVYQYETPEFIEQKGIEVIFGTARFLNPHTIQVGAQTLEAKKFIIATGAYPFIPPIPGLNDLPYLTHMEIFDNERLPERFMVIGAGPIGSEIAQAYQRLGSQVTLIDVGLLPREEPEVARAMGQVFAREGLQFVTGLVTAARQERDEIVLTVKEQEHRGDMLLVATSRAPLVQGLDLDNAGITFSAKGIPVDKYLRTNVKHIYAVGDCIEGNHQFTHLAGWQGFEAVRNALLPFNDKGFREVMTWATFTEPEVARAGLSEAEAREKLGNDVQVTHWPLDQVDRAVAENDQTGFIKVIHKKNGKLLGVTIVAKRAGEMITEYVIALERGLKLFDLANTMHVYPTYSIATMRLAAKVTTDQVMNSLTGTILRKLAGSNIL